MDFDTGLIFFISLVLMWIKPGPAQLLKIATTLNKGFFHGFAISLGSIVVCCFFFVVAALGYKVLSDVFQYTGKILQIFGGVYLLYLAFKSFQKICSTKILRKEAEVINHKTLLGYFIGGILITLSNPFWLFYFIGILPALLPLEDFTYNSFTIGIALVCLSAVIVDGPMLVLVSQLQKSFSNEKIDRALNIFISFSFLFIALFLFYSAFFGGMQEFDILETL